MRRGQAGRILIYVLTAVIGALTLVFGYRVIGGLTASSDKILLNDFRAELSRDIDLASSFGAVQTRTYRLPAKVRELCLIDTTGDPDLSEQRYPVVYDSWTSDALQNVFLLPLDEQFTVETIHLAARDALGRREKHSLCLPVRGAVTLRMYGEGNATRVEPDER